MGAHGALGRIILREGLIVRFPHPLNVSVSSNEVIMLLIFYTRDGIFSPQFQPTFGSFCRQLKTQRLG